MFGQTGFGQPTPAGGLLFGQQLQQNTLQPPATIGLFGAAQPQQTQGGNTLFGQPQITTAGGFFGQAQQQQQQPQIGFGGVAAFNQPPQNQPAPGGLFGGGAAQPQTTGFGGGVQPTGGFGTQFQGMGFGAQTQTGVFGQQNPPQFGQQNVNQTLGGFLQQPQQQAQTGAFAGFGGNQGLQTQTTGTFGNFGTDPQQARTLYSGDQNQYPQQITTFGAALTSDKFTPVENIGINFQSIKLEPPFDKPSIQMLKLADFNKAKNQPSINYEAQAKIEYDQQPAKYPCQQQLQKLQTEAGTQNGSGSRTVINNQAQAGFQQQNHQVNPWGVQQTPVIGGQLNQQPQGAFAQTGNGLAGLFQNNAVANNTVGIFGAGQQANNLAQQPTPGLFGNQNKPPSTGAGLFGAQTPAQQQPGAGLFGNQPTNTGNVGLFNQTPQTQGGLFNAPTNQQPNLKVNVNIGAGGLFGGQGNATGGMFQNQTQQQQQTQQTGLFANAQQPVQQQPVGLFGQPAQQVAPAGGLFGGQVAQQQPGGGGLFNQGNQQQQTYSKPGGLFGATAGGGLFGTQTATQQPGGGGLFGMQPNPTGNLQGQPAQTPGLQMQAYQNQTNSAPHAYESMYSTNDPLGITNSFILKDHPMDNIKKEIDDILKQIEREHAPSNGREDIVTNRLPAYLGEISAPINIGLVQPGLAQYAGLNQTVLELRKNEETEQWKFKQLQEQQLQARKGMKSGQPSTILGLGRNKSSIFSKTSSQQSQKLDLSRSHNQTLEVTSIESSSTKEYLKINAVLKFKDTEQNTYFNLHKTRKTDDLKTRVLRWLSNEFQFDGDASEVVLQIDGKVIPSGKPLADANITGDTTIVVRIPSLEPVETVAVASLEDAAPKIDIKLTQDHKQTLAIQLIPEEAKSALVPKKPEQGYICSPSFAELEKMTTQQLQKINQFKISNEFGSVQFLGDTDVTQVDLADVVLIKEQVVEVYDDERHKETKPAVGQKLNRPAIITINNVKPNAGQTVSDKEKNLKAFLAKSEDCEHLSYDQISFQWQFKVAHFTKYGVPQDESMEQPVPEVPVDVPERSAFDEEFEIIPDSILQKIPQKDVEMNSGAPATLFKSGKLNSSNQKQRKLQELINMPIQKPTFLTSFQECLRPASVKINQEVSGSVQMLTNIKQKKEGFSRLQPIDCQKPDNATTVQYLKQLGFKNLNNSSIARRGVIRPCFHPSGTGILKVEGNTISMLRVPETKPFSLLPLLTQTVEVQNQGPQIHQEFSNLSIQSLPVDHVMEDVSENCKTQFTDQFFRKMLEVPLAEASLFNGRKSICNFLYLAANHYKSSLALRKEDERNQSIRQHIFKLNQEFNVICMLNALYGNPNLHLVQLHPAYKGPKNIDRAETFDTDLAEDCIIMVKKRRNAVTEVLKFVCQQKFPLAADYESNQSEANVYKSALQMLEVGDIRGCVKYLNKNKKTKLALVVSQSVSNTAAMHELRTHLNQSERAQGGLSNILNYIVCELKPLRSWETTLLSALMYEKCHSEPLAQIISSQQQILQNEDSLIWKILLVYARVQHAEKAVWEMQGANLLDGHDSRDYRIRWMTLLVLRNALLENQIQQQMDEKWSPHIPDSVLCDYSVKFINQLMSRKNSKDEEIRAEACMVAYLIPISKFRKRVLLEILMRNSDEPNCRVFLSNDFVQSVRALKFQSLMHSSRAIDIWIKLGNYTQAESVLRKDYLPQHLKQDSDLSHILKFYKPSTLSLFTQLDSKPTRNQTGAVDSFIDIIKEKYPGSWNLTLCGLYQRTQKVLKVLSAVRPDYLLLQREINQIQTALEIQDEESLAVEWMRLQLAEAVIVVAQKSEQALKEQVTEIAGLPSDQAHRLCSWVMQSSVVQLARIAE